MKFITLTIYHGLLCSCFIIFILIHNIQGFVVPNNNEKCRYLRVEKMLKAQCRGMNLRDVPQYISSGVEILDLSFNRLRKLKKSSFQRYKSVQYLLLYDNMIYSIETGTFSHLDSLEEIDLSNNALLTLPLELFNLPSLRNLYVDSNELIHLDDDLTNLEKPIKAPLEYLNIADCGLNDLPYLGIVPSMWHLNASSNPLQEITLQKFSPMCHLKSVDLDKTSIPYCSCQVIMMFLGMRKIKAHNNFCDTIIRNIEETSCQDTANITIFDDDFHACSAVIVSTKIQITWVFIAVCVAVGFVILISIVLCINKRKKTKIKQIKLSQTTANTKRGIIENNIEDKLLGS